MDQNDLATQLLFTTVFIKVSKNNGEETGTGFIVNIVNPLDKTQVAPILITAKHVIIGAEAGLIGLHGKSGESPDPTKKRIIRVDKQFFTSIVDSSEDISAIPLGPLVNQLQQNGLGIFFRGLGTELIPTDDATKSLSAIEELTVIGYPSGIIDEQNLLPIVRRGISSTPIWNKYSGHNVFLVDAGIFPGSSGSPVLIFNRGSYSIGNGIVLGNRALLVGMICQSIQRIETQNNVHLGLGVALNSHALSEYMDKVSKKLFPS